jgi:hypothetical protein
MLALYRIWGAAGLPPLNNTASKPLIEGLLYTTLVHSLGMGGGHPRGLYT